MKLAFGRARDMTSFQISPAVFWIARTSYTGPDGPTCRSFACSNDLASIDRELALEREQAERYHALRDQQDKCELDIRNIEAQLAEVDRFRNEASGEPSVGRRAGVAFADAGRQPGGTVQGRKEIDELRENWTRLQATRRMIEVYRETLIRQRLPRNPWFMALLMAGILAPLIIGVIVGHRMIISIGIAFAMLGIVTLVLATIARSRFESAQAQARLQLEMTHREIEARTIRAAEGAGIDPSDIASKLRRDRKHGILAGGYWAWPRHRGATRSV